MLGREETMDHQRPPVQPVTRREFLKAAGLGLGALAGAGLACGRGGRQAGQTPSPPPAAQPTAVSLVTNPPSTPVPTLSPAPVPTQHPELAADLVDNGITLCGGGAMLRGINTVISNATGLDVRTADDPLTVVARGTAVYLENIDLLKETMESGEDQI